MGFTLFYGNLGGCEDVNEGIFSATKNLSTSASSRDGTTDKLKVRPTKKAWASRLFLHSQTLWQPLPCPTSVGSSLKLNFHHADGSIVLWAPGSIVNSCFFIIFWFCWWAIVKSNCSWAKRSNCSEFLNVHCSIHSNLPNSSWAKAKRAIEINCSWTKRPNRSDRQKNHFTKGKTPLLSTGCVESNCNCNKCWMEQCIFETQLMKKHLWTTYHLNWSSDCVLQKPQTLFHVLGPNNTTAYHSAEMH